MENQEKLKIKKTIKIINNMIDDIDAIKDKEIDRFNDIPNKYRTGAETQNRIHELEAATNYLYESMTLLKSSIGII